MIKRRKEGKKEKERDMLIKIRKKLKGGMKREDGNKNTHTHTHTRGVANQRVCHRCKDEE